MKLFVTNYNKVIISFKYNYSLSSNENYKYNINWNIITWLIKRDEIKSIKENSYHNGHNKSKLFMNEFSFKVDKNLGHYRRSWNFQIITFAEVTFVNFENVGRTSIAKV